MTKSKYYYEYCRNTDETCLEKNCVCCSRDVCCYEICGCKVTIDKVLINTFKLIKKKFLSALNIH